MRFLLRERGGRASQVPKAVFFCPFYPIAIVAAISEARYGMVVCMVMHKTTVYLPETLKRELERASVESGRSEAELIREGVRLAIAELAPPRPHFGAFDSGDPTLARRVDELLAGFGER